jgi:hypothetical protein
MKSDMDTTKFLALQCVSVEGRQELIEGLARHLREEIQLPSAGCEWVMTWFAEVLDEVAPLMSQMAVPNSEMPVAGRVHQNLSKVANVWMLQAVVARVALWQVRTAR